MTIEDIRQLLRTRQSMEPIPAKMKVRMHIEKFDMTGDDPQPVEYIVVDDEGRVERPEG